MESTELESTPTSMPNAPTNATNVSANKSEKKLSSKLKPRSTPSKKLAQRTKWTDATLHTFSERWSSATKLFTPKRSHAHYQPPQPPTKPNAACYADQEPKPSPPKLPSAKLQSPQLFHAKDDSDRSSRRLPLRGQSAQNLAVEDNKPVTLRLCASSPTKTTKLLRSDEESPNNNVRCTRVLTGADGVNGPCAVPLAALDKNNEPGNAKVVHRVLEDALETPSSGKSTAKCSHSLLLPTAQCTLILVKTVHAVILNGLAGATVALTVTAKKDSDGKVTNVTVNGLKNTKNATKEPTTPAPSNNVTACTEFKRATSPATNKKPSKLLTSPPAEAEPLTPVTTCTMVDESTTVSTPLMDKFMY